jgi:hypothetical protein
MTSFSLALRWVVVPFAFCSALFAAEPAKSLRDVLTPEAFKNSGLEKLSAEELNYLNIQLFGEVRTKQASQAERPKKADTPAPASEQGIIASLPSGEAAFGQEEKLAVEVVKIQKVPDEIHSRIAGHFEGWSGKTVFILENGQHWKQTESGNFDVSLDSPEVTIKKGLFGVFYLRVSGYGSTVKVKRIK